MKICYSSNPLIFKTLLSLKGNVFETLVLWETNDPNGTLSGCFLANTNKLSRIGCSRWKHLISETNDKKVFQEYFLSQLKSKRLWHFRYSCCTWFCLSNIWRHALEIIANINIYERYWGKKWLRISRNRYCRNVFKNVGTSAFAQKWSGFICKKKLVRYINEYYGRKYCEIL